MVNYVVKILSRREEMIKVLIHMIHSGVRKLKYKVLVSGW